MWDSLPSPQSCSFFFCSTPGFLFIGGSPARDLLLSICAFCALSRSARRAGGGAAGLLVRSSVLSQRRMGEEQEETPTLLAGRNNVYGQSPWLFRVLPLSSSILLVLVFTHFLCITKSL